MLRTRQSQPKETRYRRVELQAQREYDDDGAGNGAKDSGGEGGIPLGSGECAECAEYADCRELRENREEDAAVEDGIDVFLTRDKTSEEITIGG